MHMLLALLAQLAQSQASVEVFRVAQSDTTLFVIRAKVPGNKLSFKRSSNTYQAVWELGIEVFRGKEPVLSDYKQLSVPRSDPLPPQDTVITFDHHILLPDADYTFKLRISASGSVLAEKTLKTKALGTGSLKLGDPLSAKMVQGQLHLCDTPELFLMTGFSTKAETLGLQWELQWVSERQTILRDSGLWVLGPGSDTALIKPDKDPLSAGEYLLRVNVIKEGKTIAKRELRFQITGINILSEREFKAVLSVLEFMFPGKTKNLAKAKDRLRAWDAFWKEVDPTPETGFNEALAAFKARYPVAREKFRKFDGTVNDMGKVFVKYGQPDEIERHPFELNALPYEIWYYYSISKTFVFVDRGGFGEYDLVAPGYFNQFGF